MSIILIKQIPDDYADFVGLGKYNKSRMPGTRDVLQAAQNYDGTYVTGLTKEDEQYYSSKLKKDFSNTSDFWEEFRVTIESDKPKIFNTENPLDDLSLKMLFANRYVAPDKEEAHKVEFREAQYYAYTEEAELKDEIVDRKSRDKALSLLLTIAEDKEKLLLYGQFLEGLKYSNKFSEDTLYKMLRAYIEDKDKEKSKNFLKAFKLSLAEIQFKIIIDKALKNRLIKSERVAKGKFVYQFGQVTLGNNIEEVYKNLMTPEYAADFLAIKQELEHK